MMDNKIIGFIGLGVMGKNMAGHLLKGGYSVHVYSRTKEKAMELVQQGAKWEDSVFEIAEKVDVVFTMVGYPFDVEEVYLGEAGLILNAKEGTFLIDMTTSKPSLAEKIFSEAKSRGLYALDAPVSGGDIGALNAALTIMVGGDEVDFQKVKPLFELMGKNVILQGGPGAGQHTKMCNQIAIASNMMGVCEAIIYAEKAGLDAKRVLESIAHGAAGSWSLSHLAPRMLSSDFEPGFYIKHFIKDLSIALEEAERLHLDLPGLSLAKKLYDQLAKEGEENSGTQALLKYYIEEMKI